MIQKLLTIVIPAYNSEAYLGGCLDSLVIPDIMNKVEVLIVNDGSKDNTLKIAKSYEDKYPDYFHVIDKENGNYGSVMNKGLSLAKGKYFRTLDSDDQYDKEGYIHFVNSLNESQADIIVSEISSCKSDGTIEHRTQFDKHLTIDQDLTIDKTFVDFLSKSNMLFVGCITYKTDLLRMSGLRWDEKVFYSDGEFLFWPLKKIKTYRLVSKPVYIYTVGREGQSISTESTLKNFHSYDVVCNSLLDEYKKCVDYSKIVVPIQRKILYDWIIKCYWDLIYNKGTHASEVKQIDAKLKEIDSYLYEKMGNDTRYNRMPFVKSFRKSNSGFWYLLSKTIYSLRQKFS